jgi:hypothetical protein
VKRRYALLAGAVLVLALANLWRWAAPGGAMREPASAAASSFRAQDFELRAGVAAAQPLQSTRDLFQPRLPPSRPAAPVVKQVEVPPAPPAGPPPKTPEQIAEEAARDELRQIKLVGVVFRGGKGQAFLVKGDQVYMVHTGGTVGERFRVESIAPDGIQLSDPASRVNGQLPVSGK